MIKEIRDAIATEEFDHLILMDLLSKYKQPYNKITRLIAAGDIIRVKKGLYVFGKKWANTPYSTEVLANLIYGPSYISLEYALSFYGMIPERVYTVTNITNKRNKFFKTPVGNFSYQYLHPEKFAVGVDLLPIDDMRYIRIATKEKALCDMVSQHKELKTRKDVLDFIVESMRIDHESIETLDPQKLQEISQVYRNRQVNLLLQLQKEMPL